MRSARRLRRSASPSPERSARRPCAGVDRDGRGQPRHKAHVVRNGIEVNADGDALGEADEGEDRVDGRQPHARRRRVGDVDAARDALDVAAEDFWVAHQLDGRPVALPNPVEERLLEIAVHPERVGVDHGHLALADVGVVAGPREQIGDVAVDRRHDSRASG